ncbi:MAG: TetR/AcrR family transcriptional regulator [Deltaproteobacteria bacterium]|nr:TetR/AcrR family transcriptional regulator [Deltaproteobacteria bacterium]
MSPGPLALRDGGHRKVATPKRSRQERGRETRERILQAAYELLLDGPLPKMEELATVAAVSRTTIYRHFPSHDALLHEVQGRYGLAPNAVATAKSLVLDAAAALILEVGLAGLTVQGVADRAGVSPMTVYKTFGDKATLLAAVFGERGPGVGLEALLPPASLGPCVPALRGLTEVGLQHCMRHRAMLRHIFCPAPSMGGVWDLALRAARATRDAWTGPFSVWMAEGALRPGPPHRAVTDLFTLISAVALFDDHEPAATGPAFDAVVDDVLERFLHGAGAQRAA